MKSVKTKAALLLLLMAVIWGYGYIGVQDAINLGWGSFSILFLRMFVASVVLTPFIFFGKNENKKIILAGSLCGLCAFLGLTFQIIGQRLTTVSNTSFISGMYIVFTPLLLRIFWKRKQPVIIYVSMALSIIGCFLLNMKFPLSFEKEYLLGNMIVLFSTIFFALQIILIAKFTQKYGILKLTAIELYAMTIYAFIGMIITNDFTIKADQGFVSVTIVGLLSSGLCSVLQMYGNKHLDESVSGIIMSLESVFGAVFALILLNESMGILQIIGCVLLFGGAALCQVKPKRKENVNIIQEIK